MLSPGLSMLWESTDAERSLRERFGLTGLDEAARWLSAVLAEHWGLGVREAPRLTLSDHNAIAWVRTDRGPLIAKLSRARDHFPELAASTWLLADLAGRGVPVAAPLPSRAGSLRVVAEAPSGPLSLAVLPEIEGDWLAVEDLEAVHDAGARLAALHDALAHLDHTALPLTAPRPLPERLCAWLSERDPGRAPAALARLSELTAGLPRPEDPPQLVHGDYRAANILVRGRRVVAVLDFDEVRLDQRVADLAQASTYLATLFRDWGPTPAPARAALRAGYESVRPLDALESRWLAALTLWQGIAAIPPRDDGRWAAAAEDLASAT